MSPDYLNFLPPFLAAFSLSWFFSFFIRKTALRYNLLPKIRQRDSHTKPLPRVGGLAIFLAFFSVSLIWFLIVNRDFQFSLESASLVDRKLVGIWVGGAVISLVMLLDDLFGLSPRTKLTTQILVAIIIIASGVGIDTLNNPFGQAINLNSVYLPIFKFQGVIYHFSLWSDLLTLIWLVGMMNVINFIDGIDGLASGISGIAAVTIFLLSLMPFVNQPAVALTSIILAGAAFGFLPLNFSPARIFMGDSGSMFLGLILGILPLISGGKLATAFLVLGFPIVDGLVVTAIRIIQKKNPLKTPDRNHIHHRFLAAGFSVRQSVMMLYLIAILFGWVALRATTKTKLEAGGLLVVLLLLMIVVLEIIKRKRNHGGCRDEGN